MANNVGAYMEKHGTRFLYHYIPKKIEKTEAGKLKVTYQSTETDEVK